MIMLDADADRLALVEMLHAGYQRAANTASETPDCFFEIGGCSIRLCFAGTALQSQLTPALAHLAAPATHEPALTLYLWDSDSTRTPPPLFVDSLIRLVRLRWFEELNGRREIKRFNDARVYATFHLGPDILSVLDRATNIGFYWVPDAQMVPFYEKSAPLQGILSAWLATQGSYYLHAAAVGRADGGVLIVGKGGSGKSTTALACLDGGLEVVGDDYCLLSNVMPPYVSSLYSVAKLESAPEQHGLAQFVAAVLNPQRDAEDKALIGLNQFAPEKLLRGFPVRAILIPHITGLSETCLRPSTAFDALQALAPSTLLQLPGSTPAAMHAMAQLVKQVPCYRLDLGTNLEMIPTVIQQLLTQ